MQRWLTLLLATAAIALAAVLTAQSVSSWRPWRAPSDAAADAASTDAAVASLDDGGTDWLGDAEPSAMPLFPTSEPRRDGGTGFRLFDGSEVPPLADGAPLRVRFGVVLVTYLGAELASPSARSKQDARELALRLAEDAKTDFHAAVRKGDDGSADDVGHVSRGTLEPAPEYVLFSLAVGKVDGPVDTPRGYWIVKRIE